MNLRQVVLAGAIAAAGCGFVTGGALAQTITTSPLGPPSAPNSSTIDPYYFLTNTPIIGSITQQGVKDAIDDAMNSSGYEKKGAPLYYSEADGTLIYGIVDANGPILAKNGDHYSLVDGNGDPVTSANGSLIQLATKHAAAHFDEDEYSQSLQGRAARNGAIMQQAMDDYFQQHGSSAAACAQQLDGVALGLSTAGLATDLAGAIVESITSPGAEFGLEVAGDVTESVGIGINLGGVITQGVANNLPNCDAEFTGTVKGDANIYAGQGIEAFDNAITIGNPDGTSYQTGIVLGGGSLAGAGTGGDQATADDGTSIAIGNGAHAGNGTTSPSYDLAIGDHANASATYSTAIGANANASADYATALGANSNAQGANSIAIGDADVSALATAGIAIGHGAVTENAGGIAMGEGAHAISADAIAIGHGAVADGSTAMGAGSAALGVNTAAYGEGAQALGTDASALGEYTFAAGTGVTAVGAQAQAQGTSVAALGSSAVAAGTGITALGDHAQAFDPASFLGGTNITSVGQDAWAFADGSTVLGQGARAFSAATDGTAVGQDAQIFASNATAVGQGARGMAVNTAAFGQGAVAQGLNSTSVGAASYAGGDGSAAFGQGAIAVADNSLAVGQASLALGRGATAVGQGAIAAGDEATAIGSGASAAFVNSAAYGTGAVATASYQQVFGTSANTYTMPGITSGTSTVRQVGPKSLVTTDHYGNLAADRELYKQIGENQQGVAMAMALGDFWVPDGKKFAFGLNTALFDGTLAVGANFGGLVHDGLHLTGGVAVSQQGMASARVGALLSW